MDPQPPLDQARRQIASKVRELRLQRRWTQAGLAARLGLSQSRLSEIERGDGSFSAEQFLAVLTLFNVGAAHFQPAAAPDAGLQNALARFGAAQLRETESLPSDRLDDVARLVKETLVVGTPRLVVALAPVLVRNIARVNLMKIYADLAALGLERRLAWTVESTLQASRDLAPLVRHRAKRATIERAGVVFAAFLEFVRASAPSRRLTAPDLLDPDIRSEETLRTVRSGRSRAAARWNIVTRIAPDDFSAALRGALEGD